MPGLVNAHTHIGMTMLRGYSDDCCLIDWLTKDIWPAEGKCVAVLCLVACNADRSLYCAGSCHLTSCATAPSWRLLVRSVQTLLFSY